MPFGTNKNQLQLRVHWVCFTSTATGEPSELRDHCKRLCTVQSSTPRMAIESIRTGAPDVVVFEFFNPDASQLQLLQAVKRHYPSVPILMITSAHSEELAVWAFRARVWNYLVKPVPLREFKSNLDQLAKIAKQRESGTRKAERPGTMLPAQHVDKPDADLSRTPLQKVIKHIRNEHTTKLNVGAFARECGVSRFTFARMFKTSFGCSYRTYVTRLRIETACRMLSGPHSSVTDVAIAAGFTDASYFARMFRKHMRTSPAEYARSAVSTRTASQDTPHTSSAWNDETVGA